MIDFPRERLASYCEAEYELYDAVDVPRDESIGMLEIVLTTAVNGNLTANDVGQIWRERGRIEAALARVPPDASILDPSWPRVSVRELVDAACSIRGVGIAVATKILHKKRPALIPMIDSVVLGYYYQRRRYSRWPSWGEIALLVMERMRDDLLAVVPALESVLADLQQSGYQLTSLRALEVLVWMVNQDRWYREGPWANSTRGG